MTDLLYPVFALVALTFVMVFWMAYARFGAFTRREVRQPDPGIRPEWPGKAGQVSNAFHNLLEVPILFYAVIAFAMILNAGDTIMLALAWLFVAARTVQAFVHATYNKIAHRFGAYLVGVATLAAMWIKLFVHVATAAG